MKAWLRVARRLYLPVVIAAFGWLIWSRWPTIVQILRQVKPGWLMAALGASVVTLVPQSWFWHRALRGFGEASSMGAVVVATCRALLTRYVPGGVWFAAGRAAILQRTGIGLPALAATGTVELAMSVSVALALGSTLLGASPDVPPWTRWLGPALLVALVLGVPWMNRGIAWLAHRRGTDLPRPLTRRMIGQLIGINGVYWLVIGTVFWLYASGFGLDAPVPATHGAFMVAWGVGFLSPFAPQGLGVFEVILGSLLKGDLADMIAIVGGFRGLMLVRDLVVWGGAELLSSQRQEGLQDHLRG